MVQNRFETNIETHDHTLSRSLFRSPDSLLSGWKGPIRREIKSMASLPIESNRARVVNAFHEVDKRSGIFIIRHLKILFRSRAYHSLNRCAVFKKKERKGGTSMRQNSNPGNWDYALTWIRAKFSFQGIKQFFRISSSSIMRIVDHVIGCKFIFSLLQTAPRRIEATHESKICW